MDLGKENIEPLRLERLELRNALQEKRDFSHEMFRYAKAFAEADEILIAAPFWDLAFPAILRNYIENICVQGLTFYYTEEGFPTSLCTVSYTHLLHIKVSRVQGFKQVV